MSGRLAHTGRNRVRDLRAASGLEVVVAFESPEGRGRTTFPQQSAVVVDPRCLNYCLRLLLPTEAQRRALTYGVC